MYDKLLKLKENKKWLFYLLFIPALIAIAIEFYNKYLINSSKEKIKETRKKDKVLKKKQEKAQAQAKEYEKKADNIEKQIDNIKVNKDWHKK